MRALLSFGLLAACLAAQPYYNLDFETVTRNRPRNWSHNGVGQIAADDSTAAQGAYSLRLQNRTNVAAASVIFPGEAFRDKRVNVSGFVRTRGIPAPGYAAIWIRADSAAGTSLLLRNMSEFAIRGDTDWRRYEYELTIPAATQRVGFGVFVSGAGEAWFDDLRLTLDGEPLKQGPAPYVGEPTEETLSFVRANSFPLATERAESGFDDLQPLKALIGDARIVALGEATHGTAEFFRMKHRLFEFLATEMGFTVFSMESNMPEAYLLNDYVLRGEGDPKKLIPGMHFFSWNTQEVLDLVEWMRKFNASGRGRVQFTGFDMQYPDLATTIVRDFIAKADAAQLAMVEEAYRLVLEADKLPFTNENLPRRRASVEAARRVRELVESRAEEYLKLHPSAEVDWVRQNARLVEYSAVNLISPNNVFRDEKMAETIDWLRQRHPGEKMVLWAHNLHISREDLWMGSHLAKRHGKDYFVIGQTFHEGVFTALGAEPGSPVSRENVAPPTHLGTVEYALYKTGQPRFVFDFRQAQPGNGGAWFLGENEFRTLGYFVTDGWHVRPTLARDFDLMIFFDRSTASDLLPDPR